MLADQRTGKDTLLLVMVKIEKLRLTRMQCCARIILRWRSFSVLKLVTRLSFESREQGAGGDIILNPLC